MKAVKPYFSFFFIGNLVLYICSSPIALCLLYLWGVLIIGLASPIVEADAADHYIFKESYFLTYSVIVSKWGKALLSTYIIASKKVNFRT